MKFIEQAFVTDFTIFDLIPPEKIDELWERIKSNLSPERRSQFVSGKMHIEHFLNLPISVTISFVDDPEVLKAQNEKIMGD